MKIAMTPTKAARFIRLRIMGGLALALLSAASAFGQTITTVSPTSAAQGTSVTVTFTLSGNVPPAGAPVTSASLGTISGTSLTHSSQYLVTGLFTVPANAALGWQDATVVFTPPTGSPITFSKTAAFQITAGSGVAAGFTGTPRIGVAPLTVSFTDASTGTITNRLWSFGDGTTGADVNPAHTYTNVGSYNVSLTVFGTDGSNQVVRSSYITVTSSNAASSALAYPIVATGQTACYNNTNQIPAPAAGQAFYGQDAQFANTPMSFTDNGDGTVTDLNTGLTWQQTPTSTRLSWSQAVSYCDTLVLGGYDDWRMPTLKELFAIGNFSQGWPYLDTNFFNISAATVSKDEQYWADNYYVGVTVEGGSNAAFGVNHGTGHIKAYPATATGTMGKLARAVRGNRYGTNQFVNNTTGTITDQATGLMWPQADSGAGMDWEDALAWAQTRNAANYLGFSNWRLPNVKELQSIVDYSRSPSATNAAKVGPAIDPMFSCTGITNEAGASDYPYYWTSTSARFEAGAPFYYAWYVAFGRAVDTSGLDLHGAGAVRFDTKYEGGPAAEGGERYYNYVRLVRTVTATDDSVGDGIPDAWRKKYFGGTGTTTNATSCAAGDPDADGFTNYNEYIADTNPTNAASYFHIAGIANTNTTNVAVSFQSSANRRYTLCQTTNLTSGVWNNVPSQSDVPGNGGTTTLTDSSPTNTQRFYRIGVRVP